MRSDALCERKVVMTKILRWDVAGDPGTMELTTKEQVYVRDFEACT
ncbi:hypothetical protein SAMN05216337_106119 [Bradyrhizobium brasilense]|uniref:Uncharacterized protein n=1 Tax=Bradyrhizobium brasilense TaxID=1419277 RepID=A0A1G7M4Q4_9BRAD|nr:hypothetical protein SAMN05216337_106119 [Bradyrhizobium brasilense]